MPNFKKEGRGFKMKGFTPFTATGLRVPSEEAQDYSHKTEKEPLFYKRYPGERTDAKKVWDNLRGNPQTRTFAHGTAGLGAFSVAQHLYRGAKSKKYALATLKGLATKTLPTVAAIHFGGKLIKGLMSRKRDDNIRKHVNKTEAKKAPHQRFRN